MDEIDEFEAIERWMEKNDTQHREMVTALMTIGLSMFNAIADQPSIDNLKFARDLIRHLDDLGGKMGEVGSVSFVVSEALRDTIQETVDSALKAAGLPADTGI